MKFINFIWEKKSLKFFIFSGGLYCNIMSEILALFALKGIGINKMSKALIDQLSYT